MKPPVRIALLSASIALLSAVAFAQALATVAGVVRDSSGAVLPGVTVEASSPALIEKVRAAVTDGNGQYRIVDLRPGAYIVTFTLPGFSIVKREGLELTGSFTATVNADLRVGSFEETITVSGESPTVDVQTTTRQRVIDSEAMNTLPSGRNQFTLGVLIPGVTLAQGGNAGQDVGGARGPDTLALLIHGSRTADQRVTVNGVPMSSMVGGGWGSGSITNPIATQEITIDTAAVSAEMATGGVRINLIPREGGNTFKGTVFGALATEGMQSNNLDADLKARGLRTVGRIQRNWDVTPGFGGPIAKDKVWFFVSARHQGANNYAPAMFYNRNANDPNKWVYEADESRPGINYGKWEGLQTRVSWQAAKKHKIGITSDEQAFCRCPDSINAVTAPEAGNDRNFPVERSIEADWTSPVSNRLLLEAAGIHRYDRWGFNHLHIRDVINPQMISVVEQGGAIPGLTYRSATQFSDNFNRTDHWRFAMSYITGSHSLKVGYNDANGINRSTAYVIQPVAYQFRDGVPNLITERSLPHTQGVDVGHDLGLFAQDKWTTGRMTVSAGVRYDHFSSGFPEQHLGPTVFSPTRNLVFAARDNLSWHDVTPKGGVVYDVSGNGKTAVKLSINKFLAGYGTAGLAASPNPIATLVTNTTRTWTDANRNYVPDCDLLSPDANGECGGLANRAFGTPLPGATFDPSLLTGWGKREFNWEFSAGVQRELAPRVSLDVSYFRRWYGNFLATDNRALAPTDFGTFSITAPTDSRLPASGSRVTGLYNINPEKFGVPAQNFVTLAKNFGTQTEHFNGVDINLGARLRSGVTLQGGTSTGRTTYNACDVVTALPEMLQGALILGGNPGAATWTPAQYCSQDSGFLSQFKGLGSYLIPKIGVQAAATYQSLPGPHVTANYIVSAAQAAAELGRPLVGVPNLTANVSEPGSVFGERLHQMDVRFSKLVRFGPRRLALNLDLYNAFNANPVVLLNNNFAAWQVPQGILQSRFVKIGGQLDF
jgi:hypothetical protein